MMNQNNLFRSSFIVHRSSFRRGDMTNEREPVVLELAPLPREQIGPFLLLGLDKDAGPDEVESHWAQRVIWARKNQTRLALEDINWAREVVRDPDRRVRADAASLNPDTAAGVLRELEARHGGGAGRIGWQPLDAEQNLKGYVPPVEVPDPQAVRAGITVPEVPREVPAAARLLEQAVRQPLDPWGLELPTEPRKE
jgi:hypothetical protein